MEYTYTAWEKYHQFNPQEYILYKCPLERWKHGAYRVCGRIIIIREKNNPIKVSEIGHCKSCGRWQQVSLRES